MLVHINNIYYLESGHGVERPAGGCLNIKRFRPRDAVRYSDVVRSLDKLRRCLVDEAKLVVADRKVTVALLAPLVRDTRSTQRASGGNGCDAALAMLASTE